MRLDPGRAFRSQARDEIHAFLGVDLPADQEGVPPLATFTVGGAGAQTGLARRLLAPIVPFHADWLHRALIGQQSPRAALQDAAAAMRARLARGGLAPASP